MTVEKPTFKHGVMAGVLIGLLVSLARPADVRTVEIVSEADPKVRVEKVVEEKIVEVPVEVKVPLPEACSRYPISLTQTVNLSNNFQGKADRFFQYVDYLDFRMISDPNARQDARIKMPTMLGKSEKVLFELFAANERAQRMLRLCKTELEE